MVALTMAIVVVVVVVAGAGDRDRAAEPSPTAEPPPGAASSATAEPPPGAASGATAEPPPGTASGATAEPPAVPPAPPAKTEEDPVAALVAQAEELVSQRRQDAAITLLVKARRTHPRDGRLPYHAGLLYLE
jgi:hypothetical protein